MEFRCKTFRATSTVTIWRPAHETISFTSWWIIKYSLHTFFNTSWFGHDRLVHSTVLLLLYQLIKVICSVKQGISDVDVSVCGTTFSLSNFKVGEVTLYKRSFVFNIFISQLIKLGWESIFFGLLFVGEPVLQLFTTAFKLSFILLFLGQNSFFENFFIVNYHQLQSRVLICLSIKSFL